MPYSTKAESDHQNETQQQRTTNRVAQQKLQQVAQLRLRSQARPASPAPSSTNSFLSMLSTLASRSGGGAPNLGRIHSSRGGGGQLSQYLGGANNIKQLARRIEKSGYNVGELEGFQGNGQETSGHSPTSLHYAGTAMDITGGRLGRLFRALKKAYGPDVIDEMFYKNKAYGAGESPIGGHDTHVHLGLLGRRF